MIVWFTVADGRLTGIFNQLNPEKVARVPALDPGAGDWPPRF
jgi:RNA polymerase sigma-70 factor (ECF subfamily)